MVSLYWFLPVAWFTSQVLKLLVGSFRAGKPVPRLFLKAGGMPSAHSALVSALVTAVGFTEGVNTSIFVVTLVFAITIMYDAFGHHNLRRHSFFEVLSGVLLGVLVITVATLV